jgi:peptidoglycan/LPS O-acetylase OafA/YrhL
VYQTRYRSLDAWRGAAALGVFFHHRFLNLLPLMGGLWMAVQLFFVISGYCIAVAADNALARDTGFGAFMRRRLRRIAPPYLASCLLAIFLRILWNGFKPLAVDWKMYLQNLGMLQWVSIIHARLSGGVVPSSASANPQLLVTAYWSLNYEEQFYLIAALLVTLALAFGRRAAVAALVALTTWVAWFNFAHNGLVTGLFCDYWLQFACGIALYVRLCKLPAGRARRLFDVALAATARGGHLCSGDSPRAVARSADVSLLRAAHLVPGLCLPALAAAPLRRAALAERAGAAVCQGGDVQLFAVCRPYSIIGGVSWAGAAPRAAYWAAGNLSAQRHFGNRLQLGLLSLIRAAIP